MENNLIFFQDLLRRKLEKLIEDLGIQSEQMFDHSTPAGIPAKSYCFGSCRKIDQKNIKMLIEYTFRAISTEIKNSNSKKIYWRARPQIEKVDYPRLGENSSSTMRIYMRFALE